MFRVLVILLVFSTSAHAQFVEDIRNSFRVKPQLDFRIGARSSFITNEHARIWGIKGGLSFDHKVRVGLGYNWLSTNIDRNTKYLLGDQEFIVPSKVNLQYVSPYFEYTFYAHNKWEIGVAAMVGVGTAGDILSNSKPELVLLYEPSMEGHYKMIPWVGVGFGVGYRLIFVGNKTLPGNFNSPIYALKLKVFFNEIYRSFRPKKD